MYNTTTHGKMEMDDMSNKNQMPREEGIDHSLSLLREGYMYILNRRHSFNSDIFETRLLGKKAICMGGKEAAEVFMTLRNLKGRMQHQTGLCKHYLARMVFNR